MSHPLCGESLLWQIFCGESSMRRILWQPFDIKPIVHKQFASLSFFVSSFSNHLLFSHENVVRLNKQFFILCILECKGTSIGNASETIEKLKYVLCRNINNLSYKDLLSDDFSSVLIDYSRDANVMSLLSQHVQECFAYLNTTISLPHQIIEIDYSFICSVLIDYTYDANDISLLSKHVQE